MSLHLELAAVSLVGGNLKHEDSLTPTIATERDSWDPPPPVQKSPTRSTGTQTPTAAVSKSSVPNRSLLDSSPFAKPSAAYRSSVDSSESTGVLIEGLSPAKKSSAAADLSSLSGGDGLLSGEDGLGAGIAAAAASSSSAPMFAVVDAPIRPLRADERAKPPRMQCSLSCYQT